ncbi:cytochrome c maturation protein CcmE [Pararhodobacter sp. SW119]|uniref:cytochrome c maturation protein CcmE n=1 Tax=Pararhodobacter sp. SW119 TaxID=2780075 RepID=UPI001ADFEFF7|nr:cytochrome c maturation protein CcmE [Pararhodobacter sp. SW119]
MRGLKKKRRVQIILVAAVSLTLSTALIGYAMRDGINFFRSPSQVMADPPPANEVFRLGGLVQPGSIRRGQGEEVYFRVTDNCTAVEVRFRGILPDLFGENEGTVGTGRWVEGIFEAHEVLAKHDETYMPREVSDSLAAMEEAHAAGAECAEMPVYEAPAPES